MHSKVTARRLGWLLVALLPTLAVAAESSSEDPREESWQIEQRQRWFEESRGLRQHPEAARLRADAAATLNLQRLALDPVRSASGETWQQIGPSSMNMVDWIMGRVAGRLNAITPLPGDDDTVYAGSAAGGVWKTTNGGQGWTPVFDEVGTLPVGAITLDPSLASTVWVGTGDKNGGGCAGYFGQGVYLSEDAGASWVARNGSGGGAMPLSIINAVAVQPTDGNVVLVGGAGSCNASGTLSGAGVYRSTDKGLSWTKVLNNNVEDLLFVPGTATVYAGLVGVGVQKSIDGGATWVPANTGISVSGSRLRLAMAPSNSAVLYVLMGSKIYRSGDAGANWTLQNSNACEGQCGYNQTIAVHPTQADTVLLGTIRVARSTDAGVSFTPLTSTWGTAQAVHQDTHVVRYSSSNPNRFWVGSDGGIWRSDDGGTSFLNMNANINITQFYDIAVNPLDANIVLGGAQDNGSSGRRTSLVWDLTFASGDGFMNAFDENTPSIVFQTSYPQGNLPNIVRSFDGGSPGSYSTMPTSGLVATSAFQFLTPMASAGSLLFVSSNVLYRANTTGNSWTAVSGNVGTISVITPQVHGSMTPAYIGTANGQIHASPDAGIPSPVFNNVTGDYPGGRVSDIAMDPVDAQRVFITRAGFGQSRLYRSTSGGTNWTAVGTGLPNVPANAVAIDPLNTNRLFVGTDIGVYESTDGGDNFSAYSAGLPLGVVVSDLEIDDLPHVLTAGTYSRGAWRVVLAGSVGNAPPTADFSIERDGLDASFSDQSLDNDGSIVSHLWDFGDGSATSVETDPMHAYPGPGNYTAALTVTDNGGLTGSYSRIVRIAAPPITLVNGIALTNQSAAQGDQVYYTLEVPIGAYDLHFETSGNVPNQDADLTVLRGSQFLCQSAGGTSDEECNFPTPQSGTYTAIVDAYTALTNYTILASYVLPPDEIFANGFD
ncbi:PKD domain-containing protein [Dokdonella immobilis]|uniref:PKD domain-containing protein n=1 Tax=Dokdonella immobilis TaxID=578942 RepID=A0A1I4X7V7_9GAMM|nr:PKD domain-containing protein [Dokdonella immobilis]SFN21526.1 PKD domain-containing protein [Dokdonella immobilis]